MRKVLNSILTIVFCLSIVSFHSCSNEEDSDLQSTIEKTSTLVATKSAILDSLLEDGIPLEETEELKAFLKKMEEIKRTKVSTYAYPDDSDPNLSSNMWAIREMPISFRARGGGNTGNRYLSTNGKRQAITLEKTARNNNQKFYLKILPSSSGIPYLIYSQAERTPLLVGQKNNDPNQKFVMPWDTDKIEYSSSWNLIPAATPGYFAIQSQAYLGQADPNNPWSVFNYVVEIKNNNVVGYAQYTKVPEQEFLLKPDGTFSLSSITFDSNTAQITDGSQIKFVSTSRNLSEEPKPFTIPISKSYNETSYFSEKRNSIEFNISNPLVKFQRPTVQANRIVLPETSTPFDATYKSTSVQNISKLLSFNIEGDAPENALIEVTTYIKTYNVSINYTAIAKYGDRQIRFSGTWRGFVIADPQFAKPTNVPRYFDLDTGEEIYVYSRSPLRVIFNK